MAVDPTVGWQYDIGVALIIAIIMVPVLVTAWKGKRARLEMEEKRRIDPDTITMSVETYMQLVDSIKEER